jgi:tRNA(Ile)-lysidine synthase
VTGRSEPELTGRGESQATDGGEPQVAGQGGSEVTGWEGRVEAPLRVLSSAESAAGLEHRFGASLVRRRSLLEGDRVVVALSGGMDSLVLLHLLRFGRSLPRLEVVAAHFDHGMRSGSEDDALWVRGLCKAWRVPLHLGRAVSVPASEEEARDSRYRFLLGVARLESARWLMTGHQADDQAETILFRILRGTGLGGLAGIPRRRPPGIYRPLLPFTRAEIGAYARTRALRPRTDPTNADTTVPRNFLRHRTLPELEAGPAPGARRALLRLARLARENEEGWQSILPRLLEGVLEEGGEGFIVRPALLAHHPAVRGKLLREALGRRGIYLDEAGTRAVLEFTRTGASGKSIDLVGGKRLTRDFDRFLVTEKEGSQEDVPLALVLSEGGPREALVGGRRFLVVWGPEEPEGFSFTLGACLSGLRFPLHLRRWMPGDRILLSYGTKKLKKLLAEAKVPVAERIRVPVLVDGKGRVLWVAGVAASALVEPSEGGQGTLYIGIRHVEGP